ncbi:MAG: type III-A CRISPR-associated protein Csm2 [Parasporobacterium sp.]|nr:type III-A CRISPR-associated protein Csm2 [Parasporobacterium sp.]
MILDESTYVGTAEQSILKLRDTSTKPKPNGKTSVDWITTSQIRNLLAMSADIYNEILGKEEKLSPEINARIDYLRVRCVYAAGRDPKVKRFIDSTHILDALKEVNGSRKRFIVFNHYMEALVAFHKFYGGKEQ